MGTILRIALALPHQSLFDYLPPQNLNIMLVPGMRIRVPFGTQEKLGILHAITDRSSVPKNRLKTIIGALDSQPVFSKKLLDLIYFVSQYYLHSLGETYSLALPKQLRQIEPLQWPQILFWALDPKHPFNPNDFKRAPKQLKLLQLLQAQKKPIASDILNQQGFSNVLLKKLLEQEYVCQSTQKQDLLNTFFDPDFLDGPKQCALPLNTDQQKARDKITQSFNTFNVFLLEGVTGSGKTEVYLQCVDTLRATDKQVLILVPEIGLTPQMVDRFRKRFTLPIVYLHSKLTDSQRFHAYLLAQSGQAKIIIATRLGCFLPLHNPGLFIIDESHDPSFKQQDGIRYCARDVLIKRAQIENCPIVLGTATPTLETSYNSLQKKYHQLLLENRATENILPNIDLIDLRTQTCHTGLSQRLLTQLQQQLDKKEQSLLFLNRRGYAPVLMCIACQYIASCKQCDAHQIFHATDFTLRCHHCERKFALPQTCPECLSPQLNPVGLGTQKLEEKLKSLFPNASIARVDKDSTQKASELQTRLANMHAGAYDILIGTQMLAKGHHFPNLTFVAILDCDTPFFSSDFRAIEQLGQLITQVAGRAGRAEKPGQVFLQTKQPEHPLLKILIQKGFRAFSQSLLAERQQTRLPPFSRQILIRAKAKQPALALNFLKQVKTLVPPSRDLKILGPTHAPMEKRQGQYRSQLLFQSSNRTCLHKTVRTLLAKISQQKATRRIHWSVDVDPLNMF